MLKAACVACSAAVRSEGVHLLPTSAGFDSTDGKFKLLCLTAKTVKVTERHRGSLGCLGALSGF